MFYGGNVMDNFKPGNPEIQAAKKYFSHNVIPAFEEQESVSKGTGRQVKLNKANNGFEASLTINNNWGITELEMKLTANPSKKPIEISGLVKTPKNEYNLQFEMNDYYSMESIRELIIGYMRDSSDNIIK